MASPASDSNKKSRATSCTSCRQVKLKCDLRERYPKPCSRCEISHHECKTDSSFKRVPARSRIKELETQLDRLKRDRAPSHPIDGHSAKLTPESEPRSLGHDLHNEVSASLSIAERLPYGPPTASGFSHIDERWLDITEDKTYSSFLLDDVQLQYYEALELFQHFEEHYRPRVSILSPVSSLRQLHHENWFLFWSIIAVAARNHPRYAARCEPIWHRLQRDCVQALSSRLALLPDRQGLLLIMRLPDQYHQCSRRPEHSTSRFGYTID